MANNIDYGQKYEDEEYEYRHVTIPKDMARTLPKHRLMTEEEWRGIGVQQSRGWQHFMIHSPEPHILLFRRPLGTDSQTGRVDPLRARKAKEEFMAKMYGNQRS